MVTVEEEKILSRFPFYVEYKKGRLSKEVFRDNLQAFRNEMIGQGVSPATIEELKTEVIRKQVAVLFDLDGTLMDSDAKIRGDLILAFSKLGLTFEKNYPTYGHWGELVKDAKCRQLASQGKPCTEEDKTKVLKEFWSVLQIESGWKEAIKTGVAKLFPETLEVLERLKNRGCKLMVLSRAGQKMTEERVEALGLNRYFPRVYSSPMQKIRELKSKTKTFAYMQAVSQEVLDEEFRKAMVNAGAFSYLFIIGDRPEDTFSGEALRRWAAAKPEYRNAKIVSIFLKREGSTFTSRFANYTASDLRQALRIIEELTV